MGRAIDEAMRYYEGLPREGRLPGRCEMRLPDALVGARVLDVLCRSGKGPSKLAERVGEGGGVLACDPDARRMARAEELRAADEAAGEPWASRLSFRVGVPEDLRAVGAADASFDLVYVNAAVNVACDFDAVLVEAFRVLADGGVMWIAGVFALDEAPDGAALALDGNVFVHARTFAQVERAAARAGFNACALRDARPLAPDGADAVPAALARSYVAADARLRKESTF